jgi:hypothetical protein
LGISSITDIDRLRNADGVKSRRPELISGPNHTGETDIDRARRWLAAARILNYASEAKNTQELLAGLELCRKLPGAVPRLEVRP